MDLSISSTSILANDTRVGWVDEPDGRGTLSILVSCISTLLLCSWTVMHLNIPRQDSSAARNFATYVYWCIFGIFGPELVIWVAWRQLLSAWALRDELEQQTALKTGWTLTHGFYALMGGFVFDFEDSFPANTPAFATGVHRLSVTPKGLLLLARCGHLPIISAKEIEDKSKADEVSKLLACIQALWMVVQVCTRIALGLSVTLLEVTTVGHVLCALVLYALWWHKPRKVTQPTVLKGEWAGPIAAFMTMSSPVGQAQMLPGFRVECENVEITGLEFLVSDDDRAQDDHGGFGPLKENELNSTFSTVREKLGLIQSHGTPSNGTSIRDTDSEQAKVSKVRWQLASQAISHYPAIRHTLRQPSDEAARKYEIAVAMYPEMPSKCRRVGDNEMTSQSSPIWMECFPQHFAVAETGNWPHDGLLRRTSGLWIGTTLWIVSIAFSAVHIAAWNAAFPSLSEAWLWRSASLYMAFCGVFWAAMHILAEHSCRLWWIWYDVMVGDAPKALVALVVLMCAFCGACYLLSRAFLIIEAFASLRSMPFTAYMVPQWTLGVPHLG